MRELIPPAFPADIPLILLAPDSEGSTTFACFSYEKALLASKRFFFSYSLSFFSNAPTFFMTSPKRSLAPSGGFSFSGLAPFFFFLPSSFISLGLLFSLLELTLADELGYAEAEFEFGPEESIFEEEPDGSMMELLPLG